MTKRKPPEWTGRSDKPTKQKAAPMVRAPKPTVVNLRCLWHTRLVVGRDHTLTGTRYVFEPGEIKSVMAPDADRLLKMEKKQPPGCCGSESNPPVIKYFETA